jgi:hypothetical protein
MKDPSSYILKGQQSEIVAKMLEASNMISSAFQKSSSFSSSLRRNRRWMTDSPKLLQWYCYTELGGGTYIPLSPKRVFISYASSEVSE